jgi:hypothetical protein
VVQHESARGKRRNLASAENDTARRGKKQKEKPKVVQLSAYQPAYVCEALIVTAMAPHSSPTIGSHGAWSVLPRAMFAELQRMLMQSMLRPGSCDDKSWCKQEVQSAEPGDVGQPTIALSSLTQNGDLKPWSLVLRRSWNSSAIFTVSTLHTSQT